MTREQVHDLMENELRCVQRGKYCDRDCAKCPLVKDDKELIEAYGYVIKALEQEPRKITLEDVKGYCKPRCLTIISNEVLYELTHVQKRKVGRWLHPYKTDIACECSVCHTQMPITEDYKFCPYCGLKMESEE